MLFLILCAHLHYTVFSEECKPFALLLYFMCLKLGNASASYPLKHFEIAQSVMACHKRVAQLPKLVASNQAITSDER